MTPKPSTYTDSLSDEWSVRAKSSGWETLTEFCSRFGRSMTRREIVSQQQITNRSVRNCSDQSTKRSDTICVFFRGCEGELVLRQRNQISQSNLVWVYHDINGMSYNGFRCRFVAAFACETYPVKMRVL